MGPALIVLTGQSTALRELGFVALRRLLVAKPWVLASQLGALRRSADALVDPRRGVFADTALAQAPRDRPLLVEELIDRGTAREAARRARTQLVITSLRALSPGVARDVLRAFGALGATSLLLHLAPFERGRGTKGDRLASPVATPPHTHRPRWT